MPTMAQHWFEEGRQEVRQERLEKTRILVLKLLAAGKEIEEIAYFIDLTVVEVKALIESHDETSR